MDEENKDENIQSLDDFFNSDDVELLDEYEENLIQYQNSVENLKEVVDYIYDTAGRYYNKTRHLSESIEQD